MAGLGRAAAERLVTPVLSARTLAAVALGGALGGVLRYLLGELAPDGTGFPWTTFAINVTGCLAIGVLAAVADGRLWLRAFLGTGFLGGFTTMSTYADQARSLFSYGRWGLALAYLAGTLTAALASVLIGLRLGDR